LLLQIEKSYSNNLPGINYISGSTKVHRFRYDLPFKFEPFFTQHFHLFTTFQTNKMIIQCIHIDVVFVSLHRPGSVIADYTIRATSDKLEFFSAANTNVSDSLQAQKIISTKADFARSGKDGRCPI